MLSTEDLHAIESTKGRLIVAYSGGVDSHVLLHYLKVKLSLSIMAVHVNHGLSKLADQWQQHCEAVCDSLDVPLQSTRVNVSSKGSVEANARDARYEVFDQLLQADDVLLMAHHQDDQIETVLFNLVRGHAPFGIQGIPRTRPLGSGQLLRPLLSVPKIEIDAYAQAEGLVWVNDESNDDTSFDRNYLRHEVVPGLKRRWPKLGEALDSSLERTEGYQQLIDSIVEKDLSRLRAKEGQLALDGFLQLPELRQKLLLRHWLDEAGVQSGVTDKSLEQYILTLKESADSPESAPLLACQPVRLQRFQQHIYRYCELGAPAKTRASLSEGKLNFGPGVMTAEKSEGRRGIVLEPKMLTIGCRQGGEKVRLDKNRSLKNLFQENNVPVFLRDHYPLIYFQNQLIGFCGMKQWGIPMLVSNEYLAPESARGWYLDWHIETVAPRSAT